jgi:hypothetical protein
LPRQCCPASAGQQRESVGQPLQDLLGGQDPGPHGGKFDRQRQTVEASAQLNDSRLVVRGQVEHPRCGGRTFGEEQNRFVLAELRQRFRSICRR